MASASELLVIEGEAALEAGDWPSARSVFKVASETEPTAEAAHGLARAEEWSGDYETAIRLYEQAFVMYRERGEVRRPAVIAARELSFLHGAVYGNAAAAAGWLARARTLIAGSPDCVEAGWVHLAECLATKNPDRIRDHAVAATALGRRFADPGLEFCGRSYEGLALVLAGHISGGFRLVDEATAAATGGEVRDYQAAGEIFCKMLLCSELTLDVRRAQQWMDVADRFGRRVHAAWIPAICSTHYGGILTASGNWTEAEERLRSAVRDYDASYRALRTAAVVRLAELRLRQGRLEESAALVQEGRSDAYAVRPQAVLLMATGEASRAARALARHLAKTGTSALRAPELALLAEAYLRAGRPNDAAAAGAELRVLAETVNLAQYRALAEYVMGLQDMGTGQAASAREHFESAAEYFGSAGLPLEAARSMLGLARLETGDDPGLALTHARNAWAVFQRLGAGSDVDAAARELRALGHKSGATVRTGGPLTAREMRVLELVAEGESNAQIAARLFISKRTVEHHVGSILAKLGLSTRAQAQAYAHRTLHKPPV